MSRDVELAELQEAWRSCRVDPGFVRDLRRCLETRVGRPTPLTRADRLAGVLGGGLRLYLKREDLAHTGCHGINSAVGQAMLARRLGKRRLVTGAGCGRHGVASASAAALFRLPCVIYMSEAAMRAHQPWVAQMRLLAAEVVPVTAPGDARENAGLEAERDWIADLAGTYYLPDPTLAERPHAEIARDLQGIVGHEARSQFLEAEGRTPDAVVAWAGGGGGSIGLFQAFADDREVRKVGVDAPAGDAQARSAVRLLATTEGILPCPDSASVLAFVAREGPGGGMGRSILIGLAGRGDGEVAGEAAGRKGMEAERCRA